MPTQKEPVGAAPTLAPLYDIASMFPYDTQRKQRKLAMSIGSEYNYERIELRHWDRFASEIHRTHAASDGEFIRFALHHYAKEMPHTFQATAEAELRSVGKTDPNEDSMQQRRELAKRIQQGQERQCGHVLRWFD
ncbi:hypothetical protein [Bifidobacterium pullorum]|uniref:hypothetical protein n=1 Tax=Bifidobacterium pullorum TaxID=78448 RepID=UPI003F230687